ncbi:MAG: hypothetical protein AAF004_03870 [Pseudomonadota bacterium]
MSENHCHTHNLVDPAQASVDKPWGITVTVPPTDPFNLLVGGKFEKSHWFETQQLRDSAFRTMRERHGFYRVGDDPSIILTRVDPQ